MATDLLEMDARASRRLRLAEQPGVLRVLAAILAHSGDSWFWLLGLGLVWLAGGPYWKGRALALAAGVLATALVVLAVKFTVRRRRPEGQWGQIYRSTDPHSFPSGHAARALMLAILALGLGPGWLGWTLLLWAPLVGLARIALGLHYLSDVLAGLLLGGVMGLVIFRAILPFF
jgi:undecaprenyl-diphosphatase